MLKPGSAFDVTLHPDGEVSYLTLPTGAGEPASYGGLARFHVERGGAYVVGQGGFAWVDVVRDGKALSTVAFGHGPACTGIRKVVTFDLVPGDYVLEVSGSSTPILRVIVAGQLTPLPAAAAQ